MRLGRIRKWALIMATGTMFQLTGPGPGCITGGDVQEIFVNAGNELVTDFYKSLINAFVFTYFPGASGGDTTTQ